MNLLCRVAQTDTKKEKAMKMRILLIAIGCLLATGSATADTVVYSADLVNDAALPADTNYDLDLETRGIDQLAAQVTATSATIASPTFNNGRASTGTITIASLTDLTTAFATNRITVLSTMSLSGAQIRLAGIPITEGTEWNRQATKALTATDIARALNVKFAGIIVSTAPNGQAVVYSTAVTAGSVGNQSFSSSVTSMTVLTPTFTGGTDNAWVQIGDTRLTANSDFGVGASTITTRNNLVTAINAHSTLGALVLAAQTGVSSDALLTAKTVGTAGNYGLTSSSPTAIVVDGLAMRGGASAATTINSANITIPSHGMGTGLGVVYSTGSNVGLSPLVWGTTYYAIKVDANTIQLASSQANALAGTSIVILSSAAPTTTNTYTLSVQAITGTPSYKWRVSNDGVNWADYTTTSAGVAVASGTLTSYTFGGATQVWDFGRIGYSKLRFAVIAPTTGAINIKNDVVGKKIE